MMMIKLPLHEPGLTTYLFFLVRVVSAVVPAIAPIPWIHAEGIVALELEVPAVSAVRETRGTVYFVTQISTISAPIASQVFLYAVTTRALEFVHLRAISLRAGHFS